MKKTKQTAAVVAEKEKTKAENAIYAVLSGLTAAAFAALNKIEPHLINASWEEKYLADSDVAEDLKESIILNKVLGEVIKVATEARDTSTAVLKGHMEAWLEKGADSGKLVAGAVSVTYYTTEGRRTLKAEKLMQKGVSPDIINACYDVGKASAAVKVTLAGEK